MYTSVGIQRDDIYFSLGGHALEVVRIARAAENVSAGPQTGAICFDKANERGGSILLLDDVFDKLDAQRVSRLLHLVVEDGFGQIFLTDSNKVRIEESFRI